MSENKKIEKIFKAMKKVVAERLASAPPCHGFDHTERVLANAEIIAGAAPHTDMDVIRFAALLHDMARTEEMAGKGCCDHAALGARDAVKLLTDAGLDAEFAGRVAECVRTHRFRDDNEPVTLEARIVYDADKLDSLGAVGIGRAFLFAGGIGAKLHNRASEALKAKSYSKDDTAYREYLVKLQFLPDDMRTAPGRRLALERIEFMHEFFERLNSECGFVAGE